MKKLIGLALGLCYVWCAQAAPLPYNTSQDDRAELQRGLEQAENQHKQVLIIFGANWCEDCRALPAGPQILSGVGAHDRFDLQKVAQAVLTIFTAVA